MTGNEVGNKQKSEMVLPSLQNDQNQQMASANPSVNATCTFQKVETDTGRRYVTNNTQAVDSRGIVEMHEKKGQIASEGMETVDAGFLFNERLPDPSEIVINNSSMEDRATLLVGLNESNPTGNSSCNIYAELKEGIRCSSGSMVNEPSETFHDSGIGLVEVEVIQSQSDPLLSQHPNLAITVEPIFEGLEVPIEDGTNCLLTQRFQLPVEVISNIDHLETPAGNLAENFDRSGHRDKRNPTRMKKKYKLRSSLGNEKAAHIGAGESSKVPDSTEEIVNATATKELKRGRRKKTRTKKVISDEYLRIRTNLRYLLNRINYEQNLIDAYSSEGWKGLSLEKLKPEKELQRATNEIVRRKMKIREVFQRLDTLCAEGRLPEALFDDEGMIASEDIFCAKCGSKDLTLDNDIILCDGACERGFHQFCLEPPLRKEDIPPDDVGWLCPGCDCKVECLDMLNESQGAKLSITDSWEKVFPETVKGTKNPTSGVSSDDSDDEDFDPESVKTDGKIRRDRSSSDESDYATASENSEPPPKDNQYLGLPSDDSEDDDYDPDAPIPDVVKEESSSSDFTSDSEDLEAAPVEDGPLESYGLPKSSSPKVQRGPKRKSSEGGGKEQVINDELQLLLNSELGESGATPISARRHVERLDYKKLHDETYGVSSDSSDDEDWNDTSSPRKRKRSDEHEKNHHEETDDSKKRPRGRRRKSGSTSTPASAKPASGKNQSSSSRGLGEAVKKRLHEAFNLNHYPDRATKESLAAELGITWQKVDKWFGNARWFFNHPAGRKINVPGNIDKKDTADLPQADPKSNEETLSNKTQRVEVIEAAGNNEKEEPNEEHDTNKGSTLVIENDKAKKPPALSSGVQTRRRSTS